MISEFPHFPDIWMFLRWKSSLDEEELWNFLESPLHEACRKFVETRQREGANLKQDLLGKLDGLEAKVDVVEKRSPEVVNGLSGETGSQDARAT